MSSVRRSIHSVGVSDRATGNDSRVRFYPDVPSRRLGVLAHDALVLILLLIFLWLALKVHDTIDKLAVLGQGVHDVGDKVPLVGGEIAGLGERGENSVHHTANLLGTLTFALPAGLLLWNVLPPRIAQIRRLTSASRVLAGLDDEERRRLVAMRAAFALPYGQLLRHTRDPLGDLAARRYEPLIEAELEDAGLLLQRQERTDAE